MNKLDFDRLIAIIAEELQSGPKKSFLAKDFNDKIVIEQYNDNEVRIVLKQNIFVDKVDTGNKKISSGVKLKLNNMKKDDYLDIVINNSIKKWRQTMDNQIERII